MIACFTYRVAPSLALLLGAATSLAGCIDPSSIGIETEDGRGSAESGSESEGSATSQGQTSGPTTGTTTDEPTAGDTESLPCPPIKYPACTVCECIDGEWSCDDSACFTCEGLECGATCLRCPDDAPDCGISTVEGVCTAEGECVGVPPPKLGFCEGALQPGFQDELGPASGCSDIIVFAHDAADERGLVVRVEAGLAQAAMATGEPQHAELSATDPAVVIEGRAGFAVTTNECSDVIVKEPDIDESWVPTAGTVIIDVVPDGLDAALATVQLVDVTLHRVQPGPAPIVVSTTFSDVLVGWLPG